MNRTFYPMTAPAFTRSLLAAALFTLPLTLLLLGGRALAAGATSPNTVVITVGGSPIKRSQIDTITALMIKAQEAQGQTADPAKRRDLEKLVATNLIGQELLDKEAKALKITPTAQELDSVWRGFKNQFPDEATFNKAIREAGDTEAKLREKLARQLKADKVLASSVSKPKLPTEKEMSDFWDKHKTEFPVNDSLRALQIVLLADAKTSAEEANQKRRKLENVRQEIIRDSAHAPDLIRHFMTEAAKISEGPEGKTGGDLQRFHPNDFSAEFKKQAQALRVGNVSPVFRTPLGFHIILLIEKFDGKYDSYKLQVMQNIVSERSAETGTELRKLLKSLAAKYPVKYLVTSYKDSSEARIYN